MDQRRDERCDKGRVKRDAPRVATRDVTRDVNDSCVTRDVESRQERRGRKRDGVVTTGAERHVIKDQSRNARGDD